MSLYWRTPLSIRPGFVLRFWFIPVAPAGDVRLGQRQRRRGDPLRVLSPADGALRPAAELLRHGAAHRQHFPR